jgi:hypothetical protein
MSFENIDVNFEKVAEQRLKSQQKQVEHEVQEESQDKEKYESKIKESALTGLLQVFQNKLNNRNSESDIESEAKSDFETINFSNKDLYVKEPGTEKVSEEELHNLIGEKKFEVPNTKLRYDQINTPINNIPSANDINPLQTTQPSNQDSTHSDQPQDVNRMSDDQIKEKIAEHKKKKTKDAN